MVRVASTGGTTVRWGETPTAHRLGINQVAVDLMCALAEVGTPMRLPRRLQMYADQLHGKGLVRKNWEARRFAGWTLTSTGLGELERMRGEARG